MEQLIPGKLGINKLLLNDLIAVNISVIPMQLPVTCTNGVCAVGFVILLDERITFQGVSFSEQHIDHIETIEAAFC